MVYLCQKAYRCLPVAIVLIVAAAGCVGSETGARGSLAAGDSSAIQPIRVSYADTVSPLQYHLIERLEESDAPKKVLHRLVVFGEGSQDRFGKTLRVVMDSLTSADTSLVALRAILYEVVRTSETAGGLRPRGWAEWVPSEGWDAAATSRREGTHRFYVYTTPPGWLVTMESPETSATQE
ncbi:MAG: hypothetical protein AMS21_04575 [Gemmatimonas sp. SG8_38_2]|nr:MAG: hypothetical protein AMS21_04575 [Gemmatimonas sp. SG8_38_2]